MRNRSLLAIALFGSLLGCFDDLGAQGDPPIGSPPTSDPGDPGASAPDDPLLGQEPSQATCLNPVAAEPTAPVTPPVAGARTTIRIHMQNPPAQVMFRDGVTAAWQPATATGPTSFEAQVHGPYVVSVVCENVSVVAYLDHHHDEWVTWQAGRTPDDAHDLTAPCVPPPGVNGIGGPMVQAGQVQLGEYVNSSDSPGWFVIEYPTAGTTHDLIASSASAIQIRRDVAIARFGDTPHLPVIDLAQAGKLLVLASFSTTNRADGEALSATVHVATPTTSTLAPIGAGTPISLRVAPSAALRATDVQTVAVAATLGTSVRSLARAFRVGWPAAYTLPDPIVGGQWAIASGLQTASWTALPAFDTLVARLDGGTASPATAAVQHVDLSPRFVAATHVTRAVVDTTVPGYQDAWRLDPSMPYTRTLTATHLTCHETAASAITDTPVAGSVGE